MDGVAGRMASYLALSTWTSRRSRFRGDGRHRDLHSLGLRVPEDIAVIGIGDDIITCDLSVVPWTSVARNSLAVGYQAAAL